MKLDVVASPLAHCPKMGISEPVAEGFESKKSYTVKNALISVAPGVGVP